MPRYVFEPPAQPAAPIRGSDALFPIRRVYCIGRNYAEHAVEMGHDPTRETPFFFQKNPDSVDFSGEFPYPSKSADVHHEIELVIALKSGGADIPVERALEHVWGYGVGLDMTRRDLQGVAKKAGRPWEIGKAFDRAAPMAPLVPASEIGHPAQGAVRLSVNGELRQKGDLNQMIWKTQEMIAYLSAHYRLAAGDLIMSGTPAGVGAVQRGDVMEGVVEGVGEICVAVV